MCLIIDLRMRIFVVGIIVFLLFAGHKANGAGHGQYLLMVDVVDFDYSDKNIFNRTNKEGPLSLTGCVSLPDGPSCHIGSASVQMKEKWFPTLIVLLKNITNEYKDHPFRLLVTACNNDRIFQYINRTINLKDLRQSVLFQEKDDNGRLSVEVDMFDILSPKSDRFDYGPHYELNSPRTFWQTVTKPSDRELSYLVLFLFSILVILLFYFCVVNCIKCCVACRGSKSQSYELSSRSDADRLDQFLEIDDVTPQPQMTPLPSGHIDITELSNDLEARVQNGTKHQRQISMLFEVPDEPYLNEGQFAETSAEIIV